MEKELISAFTAAYKWCDAVIVADYNKGILTTNMINTLQNLKKYSHRFIAVDSKRLSLYKRINPSFVKPNYEETLRLLLLPYRSSARASQILQAGKMIYRKTGAEIIAVTLDAEGAVVFDKGKLVYHCCAHQVAIPRVVGAGDTFTSAFTLALISHAAIPEATELASAAAAVAVSKETTACCTQDEIFSFWGTNNKYIADLDKMSELCKKYRSQGKRIVFTNGCFDILHSGHVNYLNRAKELADVMILGVNNDESIRRIKGACRPINPLPDRIQVLSGLSAIDHIIAFGKKNDDTPVELIKSIRPDIFVKGGDYSKDKLPEASIVENLGGEVRILPHVPDHSTTRIIRRIYEISSSNSVTA
jgi:D-beta-D-heptose 7-phosphate kinase/D-beta-D-heptose 1-phosphate adenosyltransferase